MATIDPRYFKVYQDGRDRMTATDYMTERETFRLAINDLEAKLERAGLDEIEGITANLASMREAIDRSVSESSTLNEQTTEQLGEVISTIEDIRQNGTGIDVQARTGIQTVTAALADTSREVRTIQSNPNNYTGAIVTIIDDDARPDFRTVWQPILNDIPDVKIGIAVVKDWTEDGSSLPISELKALQDKGHDLLCHTSHHEPSYEITPERAEADYPLAVQWMKEKGLKGHEHLVYPGGLNRNSVNIKNVARKHFKYAVSTETAGDYAMTPVDNWCIPRINGDVKTLEQLKSAVDHAKANGIWLVLMTHSHVLKAEGSQKIRDFITYVKSQNVPIMKYTDAIKYKGNAVALGEHTNPNSTFIDMSGKSKSSSLTIESGNWTPSLVGSSTAGTHTYATQIGSYSKFGNIVIARFELRIEYASLDQNMAGNLRVSGLPFIPLATENTSAFTPEYNILNLGTNFTHVVMKTNGVSNQLVMLKAGNNIATAFVGKADIPANQPFVLRGQVMYRTS